MTMSDPLGDMITRIRNGQRAKMATITCPASILHENVLSVLQREGYIRGFSKIVPDKKVKGQGGALLSIELKYYEGAAVIREIKRVSKPGRRVYSQIADLKRVYNGLGIAIISTPRGVMSDNQARSSNVGGEVLCEVF
ncbi:MAG: 30S ribosomal protein S8 [Alphaproteobacteria bacterium]|nr:30S ribosomal protein S8 [Alphaproteobacteria bacterium]